MSSQPVLRPSESRSATCYEGPSGAYQCLVVASSGSRREMLSWAAVDGGWEAIACGTADGAAAQAKRAVIRLAIVDLEYSDGSESGAFRNLLEQLARTSDLLLMVCGHEGNAREEIWARQLGAWLYLPAVNEGGDLAVLCGEARHVAERLAVGNGAGGIRRVRHGAQRP
ncbi:MAG: hypothetical protein ACYC0Y_29055 [Pirellulales bacterium]